LATTTSQSVGTKKAAAQSVTYGDYSSSVNFEVTQGDCKVSITSVTGDYGDITIAYTLEDDRAGTASIKPMWATSESGAYSEMTKGTGGDAKTTLSTSASGTAHTFVWDTVTDLGIDHKGKVWIKIRAYDRDNHIGDWMESGALPQSIDNAPEAPTITSPSAGYFDKNTTPQIIGTIPDPKAGNSDLHIKIQIATDSAFNDDDIEQTYESRLDQTGFEYQDGLSTWTAFPETGIPVSSDPTLIGNSWRYTIQTEFELTESIKYIRAAAGGLGV